MAPPQQSSRRMRGETLLVIALLAIAALIVGGLIWAKNNVTEIKKWRGGNAWSLTYEATSARGAPQAAALVYRHNPDSFEPDYKDERLGPTKLPWRTEVAVNTGQEARVEVTPTGDGVASCRILLDGVRVVASGKSPGPGKPAVCHVITSNTPEKWPR
ncbi:hypothetical protein SSP35_01_00990 [Streptomyces sp. NBRC 110611]|uniref:hypothetical protein n=1 Tax=Streptomyces sp. NBRC 110611 TaxID=1621259 RepID=UPI000833BDD8|nr:hypothetical protein [Streptomyces sp. NBRC 110611]GAU64763.1 hypothetical protein SSP35_01_00990 [Streptomyces sp. NBRC 110611]